MAFKIRTYPNLDSNVSYRSSHGAALLTTIAAAAAAGCLAAHATAGPTAAVVHGFAVAMAWGAGLLVLTAIPVAVFTTAAAPARRPAA